MVEIQMNKFTVQELADFYQKLADGSKLDYALLPKDSFGHPENGPHLGCSKDVWRIKPTHKVIDLSVLIESGVLCVFFYPSTPSRATGKLKEIRGSAYVSDNRDSSGRPIISRACSPLRNHKHAWQGGECPLPEGFRVKVWVRGDRNAKLLGYVANWNHSTTNQYDDIIAFEVLGLADGYVMPWEQDNDKQRS